MLPLKSFFDYCQGHSYEDMSIQCHIGKQYQMLRLNNTKTTIVDRISNITKTPSISLLLQSGTDHANSAMLTCINDACHWTSHTQVKGCIFNWDAYLKWKILRSTYLSQSFTPFLKWKKPSKVRKWMSFITMCTNTKIYGSSSNYFISFSSLFDSALQDLPTHTGLDQKKFTSNY